MTYVVFPDEGHGFARPENNIAFNAMTEKFLATCLGGRAEPIGDALKPSTAQVRRARAASRVWLRRYGRLIGPALPAWLGC